MFYIQYFVKRSKFFYYYTSKVLCTKLVITSTLTLRARCGNKNWNMKYYICKFAQHISLQHSFITFTSLKHSIIFLSTQATIVHFIQVRIVKLQPKYKITSDQHLKQISSGLWKIVVLPQSCNTLTKIAKESYIIFVL